MRILTCNVRYSGAKDGDNSWAYRKQLCLDVIRAQQADIICCQEATAEQYAYLSAGLPGFAWFGMIDEAHTTGPVNSIFYRRAAFRLLSAGGYWLSQTPHVPGSKSWDSDCVRLCNWLRLIDQASGREFRIANTHLDHISQPARLNQARLINEDTLAYNPTYPQMLTGDMNCDETNPAIILFKEAGWRDTYAAVHGAGPGMTFHGFHGPAFTGPEGRIDWIFMRGSLQATAAALITANSAGRYPSDHYFLSADVTV